MPLVMILHGCRQTEVNMINETRFKDLAERDNFIAVYPFITSYDGMRETNCWGFFLDQHIHKGAGEAEDLHQIALEIEAELKIDPKSALCDRPVLGRRNVGGARRGAQRLFCRGRLGRGLALRRDLLRGGFLLRQSGE